MTLETGISSRSVHNCNQSLCMLGVLAGCVLSPFISFSWVLCCQKWQIWLNSDILKLLVPMPSGRTNYLFWGNWNSKNPEQNERELNYGWEAIWLTNPKSRAAGYETRSMCLMRAALTLPGSYWDLVLFLSRHLFSGLTFHTHPVKAFSKIFQSTWSFQVSAWQCIRITSHFHSSEG